MNGACPHCRRVVEMTDAVWDPATMRYWHTRCVRSKLTVRLNTLQKKITKGTLTIDEAREVDEIKLELKGYEEIEGQLKSKEVKLLQKALASTTPVFSKEDPRYIDVDALSIRLRSTQTFVKRREELYEKPKKLLNAKEV